MKEETIKLYKLINPKIKVGDKVKIWDGSSLSCDNGPKKDYCIICSYPELTGVDSKLEDLIGTVTQINVTTHISMCIMPWAYLQDIVVKIGNAEFRTASKMVTKV